MEYGCAGLGHGEQGAYAVRLGGGRYVERSLMQARSIQDAERIRLIPAAYRGLGDILAITKKSPPDPLSYTFSAIPMSPSLRHRTASPGPLRGTSRPRERTVANIL